MAETPSKVNFSITTTLPTMIAGLKAGIEAIEGDGVVRSAALGLLAVQHDRIHKRGEASDGGLISDSGYSEKYLKQRQGKYNRTSSTLVILSLTSQMENDYTAGPSGGGWGLGFNNPTNFDKSEHLEERFGEIYRPTADEWALIEQVVEAETLRLLGL